MHENLKWQCFHKLLEEITECFTEVKQVFLLYLWESLVTLELISLIPLVGPPDTNPLAVKLLDNRLFMNVSCVIILRPFTTKFSFMLALVFIEFSTSLSFFYFCWVIVYVCRFPHISQFYLGIYYHLAMGKNNFFLFRKKRPQVGFEPMTPTTNQNIHVLMTARLWPCFENDFYTIRLSPTLLAFFSMAQIRRKKT